jgi:hypothetical protein
MRTAARTGAVEPSAPTRGKIDGTAIPGASRTAMAASARFCAGSLRSLTNFMSRAMRSPGTTPPSSGPGWKIGLFRGRAFSSARTWLLLRMKLRRHPSRDSRRCPPWRSPSPGSRPSTLPGRDEAAAGRSAPGRRIGRSRPRPWHSFDALGHPMGLGDRLQRHLLRNVEPDRGGRGSSGRSGSWDRRPRRRCCPDERSRAPARRTCVSAPPLLAESETPLVAWPEQGVADLPCALPCCLLQPAASWRLDRWRTQRLNGFSAADEDPSTPGHGTPVQVMALSTTRGSATLRR